MTSKIPNRYARFTRNVRHQSTYTCAECGKCTRDTGQGEGGVQMCRKCYDAAGLLNAHYDGLHDGAPEKGCGECEAAGLPSGSQALQH